MSSSKPSCLAYLLKLAAKRFSHTVKHSLRHLNLRNRRQPSSDLCIPIEVASDILSRLPTKDVIRYQCVCKAWRDEIQNPEFIKSHTVKFDKGNYNTNSYILFSDWILPSSDLFCLDFGSSHEVKKLIPLPRIPKVDYHPVGSCNGLICLRDTLMDNFCICNLATGSLHITPYLIPKHSNWNKINIGFGYDRTSDGYKILYILEYFIHLKRYAESWVYSLKNNSWKVIPSLGYYQSLHFSKRCNSSMVFSNNALHWINPSRLSITSFDLGTEEYHKIVFPQDSDIQQPYRMELIGLNGSLHLVRYKWTDEKKDCYDIEIWVMTTYPVQWTKLIHIALPLHVYFPSAKPNTLVPPFPYAYSKDKKEIIIGIETSSKSFISTNYFTSCDINSGKLRELKVCGGVPGRYYISMPLECFSLVRPSPLE